MASELNTAQVIMITKKRIQRIEDKLRDLETEILELKNFFAPLSDEAKPVVLKEDPPENPVDPMLRKKSVTLKPGQFEFVKSEVMPSPSDDSFDQDSIEIETQLQVPKPAAPPVTQMEVSPLEIKALRIIAALEESERQLPYLANQLNFGLPQTKAILEQLQQKGLIYSPDLTANDPLLEIDQKGVELLVKKGLL